jgi:transcriptional regulator with XRE-family HTH domain
MLIRKLREDKGISQEQLAESAHLSLRTIQRVEAGHRVSYASLRSLAATFDINVDLLERELYAMTTTKDEYIEKPLWVRLVLGLPSLGRLDRPGLLRHEASLVAYAIFAYAASFIILKVETPYWSLTTVDLLHFSAFSALLLAYVAAITLRFRDKFKTWAPTST